MKHILLTPFYIALLPFVLLALSFGFLAVLVAETLGIEERYR